MLREQGALCIGIYRLLEEEEETEDQVDTFTKLTGRKYKEENQQLKNRNDHQNRWTI